MRTDRSLPYKGEGVSALGKSLSRGVSVHGVSVHGGLWGRPNCGQKDACENITLSQTSFAGGNNNTYPLV